jgi:hypothetical protein
MGKAIVTAPDKPLAASVNEAGTRTTIPQAGSALTERNILLFSVLIEFASVMNLAKSVSGSTRGYQSCADIANSPTRR